MNVNQFNLLQENKEIKIISPIEQQQEAPLASWFRPERLRGEHSEVGMRCRRSAKEKRKGESENWTIFILEEKKIDVRRAVQVEKMEHTMGGGGNVVWWEKRPLTVRHGLRVAGSSKRDGDGDTVKWKMASFVLGRPFCDLPKWRRFVAVWGLWRRPKVVSFLLGPGNGVSILKQLKMKRRAHISSSKQALYIYRVLIYTHPNN